MPAKELQKCKKLLLMISGLAQIVAVHSSTMAVMQASSGTDCYVPGFTYSPNQVPGQGVKPPLHATHGRTLSNPVQLYTLPYAPPKDGSSGTNTIIPKPLADLRATAAACEADSACGLFTSDGYIVGAYRHTLARGMIEQARSEADIFLWQPMHHCTWGCCGTWVADDLVAQLLQPVPKTPGANNVRAVPASKLPTDGVKQYKLDPDLHTTVCAGKPPPQPLMIGSTLASPPGSPGCPKRCLTACCKQLDSGDTIVGNHFFSQCSGEVCMLCGFSNSVVAGWSAEIVLMRHYLRQRPRGPRIAGAGGVSNCRRFNGGAAETGSGSLC